MKKSSPYFTIITPFYRGEAFLERAILSLKNQTFQDFEMLLVNDGDPGITAEEFNKHIENDFARSVNIDNIKGQNQAKFIFDKLRVGDERFKYFEKENGGQSSARNLAIDNSTGKFILQLDQDDYFSPNHLEDIYTQLELKKDRWENTIFYFKDFQVFYYNEYGDKVLIQGPAIQDRSKFVNINTCLVNKQVGFMFAVVNRKLIANVRYESITKGMEDAEILTRIALERQNKKEDTYFAELNVNSLMKRDHPESITTMDNKNGKRLEYQDMQNLYRCYLQKYNLTLKQKIICYLGLVRFKIYPNRKMLLPVRKVLTLTSKLIAGWY